MSAAPTQASKDWGLMRQQLIDHEGIRLSAYQDSLGYWTIGVGRLIDSRKGGGITRGEAMQLLDNDMQRVINALAETWPWFADLDTPRQRVMIDLGFNLGIAGLMGFDTFLQLMETHQFNAAADDLLKTKYAHQLPKRAADLAALLRGTTP